ncbi:MAG: GTP-binding protein [Chromatiales bacterium]|nr:GTP-binding protein [Chromatiales bacterium]
MSEAEAPRRKICLIGDFGVGKTSLARRFVHQTFSDNYLTTVGVKVDTKDVTLPDGRPLRLIVWDVAGTDTATETFKKYLRGAAGLLMVADGTRVDTLERVLALREQLRDNCQGIPFVGLLNKRDLGPLWEVDAVRLALLREQGQSWYLTSALSGENVERAFLDLAARTMPP